MCAKTPGPRPISMKAGPSLQSRTVAMGAVHASQQLLSRFRQRMLGSWSLGSYRQGLLLSLHACLQTL